VPTTIPGQVFCDGYDPAPDPTSEDNECPEWATRPVTRPADGWLAASDAADQDGLWRSSIEEIGGYDPLDDLVGRAVAAAPTGFSLSGSEARANDACVDQSVVLGVSFSAADEAQLQVTRMRLLGPVSWFEEGYPPTGRSTDDDGTEIAFYDSPTVAKVWTVSPDGTLTKITAYGANADRRSGWPTTMPPGSDPQPPATPLTITADDLLAMARAL